MKKNGGIENPKIIYNGHNWKFTDIKKDYSRRRNRKHGEKNSYLELNKEPHEN